MEIVELQNGKYAVRKFFFFGFVEGVFFNWGYKDSSGRYFEEAIYVNKYCIFDNYEQALVVKNLPERVEKIKIKRICG